MRNMSTPVFTSGKLRLMVPHISRCGANLEEMLGEAARVGDVLDAKELFGKFALDAIASSSFGIESNSFKDPESLFRINALKLTRYLILRSWLSTIDDCFFFVISGIQNMQKSLIYQNSSSCLSLPGLL